MRSSSIASRSAALTGVANGSSPASSASSRSSRAQKPWNVRDRELLVARRRAGPRAARAAVGRGGREAQHEQGLRRRARLDEMQEALGEHGRLAGARAAEDQQRAAGMLDGLLAAQGSAAGTFVGYGAR